MQDDAKINKPCAQLPLFAFGLHGPGDVIGEMQRREGDVSLFRCDCVRVHFPVKRSVGQKNACSRSRSILGPSSERA